MPRRDGTGPMGFGPGTGRGRGWCFSGSGKKGMKRVLWGAVIPLAGAVIKDITNPHGIIRSLLGKLSFRRTLSYPTKKVDASYTILNDEDINKQNSGKDIA
jgi:hypothetical protein